MNILEFCRKTYQDQIRVMDIDPELKRALKTHERVPVFIDNLARELSKPEVKASKDTVERAIRDMTTFFAQVVQRSNTERTLSDIAKLMIKKEQEAKAEFRREAELLEQKGTTLVTENEKGETEKQTIQFDA